MDVYRASQERDKKNQESVPKYPKGAPFDKFIFGKIFFCGKAFCFKTLATRSKIHVV